jgi:hypothetical protein
MPFKTKKMPEIDIAIQADDWEYLQDNHGGLAASIKDRVDKGDDPKEIYRYVLRKVGLGRMPIALRCLHAAQYLEKDKQEGA